MEHTGREQRTAGLWLLLVALIWGTGFIATEVALRAQWDASAIMALRFLVAALLLLPFQIKKFRLASRKTFLVGTGAGVFLCPAFFAQTYGQALSSVSHSAFLTATNVVMVPFIAWGLTRRRPSGKIYLLALLTLVGVGILTLRPETDGAAMGTGDFLVLLGAFLFAVQIAFLGVFAAGQDAQMITFLQLGTAAVLSVLAMLLSKAPLPSPSQFNQGLWPVLYLACFSTCLCFFIQTKAQQHTAPAKAAIVLSAEGLFGSLFSVLLGFEAFTWQLLLGGVVIIACVILTEIDIPSLSKRK